MGSPNFTPDKLLSRTFGYEPEYNEGNTDFDFEYQDLVQSISAKLEGLDENLFGAKIEYGYHNGFVIHSEGVSSNVMIASQDKEWILNEMHIALLKTLKDQKLLSHFVNGTHYSLIDDGHTPIKHSVEDLYIYEVISIATDNYSQFQDILHAHSDVLLNALNESGIKISGHDDIDDLYYAIDEALDPKALRKAVSNCIEAELARFERDITLIAQDYGLKQLVGVTWTSHLADVDYDEILHENEQA